jgi:hypothetical protein
LFLVASVAVRVTGMAVAAMQRLDRLEEDVFGGRVTARNSVGTSIRNLPQGKSQKSKVKTQNQQRAMRKKSMSSSTC